MLESAIQVLKKKWQIVTEFGTKVLPFGNAENEGLLISLPVITVQLTCKFVSGSVTSTSTS
jgi:hypothetical protein